MPETEEGKSNEGQLPFNEWDEQRVQIYRFFHIIIMKFSRWNSFFQIGNLQQTFVDEHQQRESMATECSIQCGLEGAIPTTRHERKYTDFDKKNMNLFLEIIGAWMEAVWQKQRRET